MNRPPISRIDVIKSLRELLAAADAKSYQGASPVESHAEIDRELERQVIAVFRLTTNMSPSTDELDDILSVYES